MSLNAEIRSAGKNTVCCMFGSSFAIVKCFEIRLTHLFLNPVETHESLAKSDIHALFDA